ncbi:MAG: hypothetical protein WCK84_12740 [Bacteroidota bacterium]
MNKIINLIIAGFRTKGDELIKDLNPFTFEGFEEIFFSKPKDKVDLFSALETAGEKLRKDGRISTAIAYECALRSLKEITGEEKFPVDEETTIHIMITRQIGRIIDRWGNKPSKKEQYIFPILQPGITPDEEYRTIQQAVQTINKNMTRICDELKIDRALLILRVIRLNI